MITNEGKIAAYNVLAGKQTGFASAIALGIGSTAATVNDTNLEFLIDLVPVSTSIVDPVNGFVYFKGSLGSSAQYDVYEVGTYSAVPDSAHNGSIIVRFANLSGWVDASGISSVDTASANTKLGGALSYSMTASQIVKGAAPLFADYSSLPDNAVFKLAYSSSNVSYVKLRFKVDDSNYYESSLTTNVWATVSKTNKSAFTMTGSPTWSTIAYVEVEAQDDATGTGKLKLDACRFDLPQKDPFQLLERVVLSTAQHKLVGVTMDVETKMTVSVS